MNFNRSDPQLMPQVEERVGPGRRLSDTRQAANLSIRDVATRLHLDIQTIRALEADEYDRLPAPTFVRGYLRGYARLLDLPPGPILEAFDQRGLEPPAVVADIAEKAQARTTDFPMRIGTYLIVTGLALLVVLWWHNQRGMKPPATPHSATQSTLATGEDRQPMAAEGDDAAPSFEVTTPPPPLAAAGDGPAPVDGSPAIAATEVGVEPGTAGSIPGLGSGRELARTPSREADESMSLAVSPRIPAPESAPASPAIIGGAVPPIPPTQSRPAKLKIESTLGAAPGTTSQRDPASTSAPAPVSTPGTAAGPGGALDRLVMHFAHESWVEVYDRHDQRLVYRLAREGGDIDVRGQGPMRVLLGNADGVRVEYNDRPHPVTSRGSGVARFVVGAPDSDASDVFVHPSAEPLVSGE